MTFDKRMTPEAAKRLLFSYKAPKNSDLREVEGTLSHLASRAATMYNKGASRSAFYNVEFVQALIRCLPPLSSGIVQTEFNKMNARLKRTALATELTKVLNIHRHVIDADIRQHGVGGESKKPRPHNNNNNNKIGRAHV